MEGGRVAESVLAPPQIVQDDVADGELGRPGGDDLADRQAGHCLSQRKGRRIGLGIAHATPHVRVDRDEAVVDQDLSGSRVGDRHLDDGKVAGTRLALWVRDEMDLFACSWKTHARRS